MRNKRGQLKLSFGMIFSIILIIIFIAFAIYAIMFFLNLQDNVSTQKLVDDMKNDVDRVWKSSESSQSFTYNVPSSITHVCFVDFSGSVTDSELYNSLESLTFGEGNFVLYSEEKISETESFNVEHLDILETTGSENPLCFESSEGEVSFVLNKDFSDSLVSVERV